MPADLLVGEDVVRVYLATVLVYLLAVDARGAGAGFEVDADAGQVGEFGGTPGAFDGFADVDGGFEMLRGRREREMLVGLIRGGTEEGNSRKTGKGWGIGGGAGLLIVDCR